MKKGVIFDLDGTLVNSMRVWENADYALAERYGFVPDDEYWSKVTSLSFLEGAAYITNRLNLNKTSSEIADELITPLYIRFIPDSPSCCQIYQKN